MVDIKAIKLTGRATGKPTLVFLDAIDLIVPDGDGSHIALRGEASIDVVESFDDILRRIPSDIIL